MDIKRLDQHDATKYRDLRLKALKIHPTAFGSSYEEESTWPLEVTENRLSNQENITLGAFLSEQLVGMITLIRNLRTKTKHNGHIVAMYVDDDYMNQGIGKALVEKVIDQAKSNQISNLFLTVTKENQKAIKLYESFGFTIYGIEKNELNIDGVFYDSYLMSLYI